MSQMGIAEQQNLVEFDEFYREQFTRLTRFVIALGGSRGEAEDIGQEAMKSLLVAWSTVEKPEAYVRQAARWIFLRQRERENTHHHEVLGDTDYVDQRDDVEMRYETACPFEVRFVLRLLAGLPPRQREVMAWTIDGYDPEEIAQLTGRNPATVRSHLRHARASLKATLVQSTNADAGKEAMKWAST